jgi:AcrR family transcriptional regulator
MPRYKESERLEIKRDTRQRLLDAAAVAFATEGYERANVDAISRAAGYAKGTIYNYFDSKRALMLALVEQIAAEHVASLAEAVRTTSEPTDRLLRFYEAGFEWVVANPGRARLMFNTLNGSDAGFREAMFAAYAPMFQLVGKEILAEGVEQGDFREVEPGPTAGLLMLVYLGAASQQDPQGRPWLAAEQVADLLLYGLLKVKGSN